MFVRLLLLFVFVFLFSFSFCKWPRPVISILVVHELTLNCIKFQSEICLFWSSDLLIFIFLKSIFWSIQVACSWPIDAFVPQLNFDEPFFRSQVLCQNGQATWLRYTNFVSWLLSNLVAEKTARWLSAPWIHFMPLWHVSDCSHLWTFVMCGWGR